MQPQPWSRTWTSMQSLAAFVHHTKIRVQYSETDQMAFAHHSNYVKYCESARWEAFRSLGCPYALLENQGILMPVIDMQFQFIKPAYYDDELEIKTLVNEPQGVRMQFHFEIYKKVACIHRANVTTAFVSKTSQRPCHPPQVLIDKLKEVMEHKALVL